VIRARRVGWARWRPVLLSGGLTLLALGAGACSSGPATTSPAMGSGSSAAPSHISVKIKNFTFSPSTFAVAPGATISVTNEDSVAHTFTSDSGHFSTGDIDPGTTKTVTAPEKAGTYSYRCMIHQFMTGTFVVR
jgi:plastocyanin